MTDSVVYSSSVSAPSPIVNIISVWPRLRARSLVAAIGVFSDCDCDASASEARIKILARRTEYVYACAGHSMRSRRRLLLLLRIWINNNNNKYYTSRGLSEDGDRCRSLIPLS